MAANNSKSKKVKTVAKKVDDSKVKNTNVKKDAAAKKTKDKTAPKRSGKNAKPGFFKRIGDYFKSTFIELKKVNWLTGDELLKSTLVVFGMVAILTIVIWIMDTGLGALTALLLNK